MRCRFTGRRSYGKLEQESVAGRDAFLRLARAVRFGDLVHTNGSKILGWKPESESEPEPDMARDWRDDHSGYPCEAVDSLGFSFMEGYHRTYTEALTRTRFVPCPPGNNPETFRHYEALEAGAIPLILATAPHSEYLKTKRKSYTLLLCCCYVILSEHCVSSIILGLVWLGLVWLGWLGWLGLG